MRLNRSRLPDLSLFWESRQPGFPHSEAWATASRTANHMTAREASTGTHMICLQSQLWMPSVRTPTHWIHSETRWENTESALAALLYFFLWAFQRSDMDDEIKLIGLQSVYDIYLERTLLYKPYSTFDEYYVNKNVESVFYSYTKTGWNNLF